MIISQNSNDVYYAYTRGRFWRWDESARVWNCLLYTSPSPRD